MEINMAGIAVISKTEVGTTMIRLVSGKDIVDQIEVNSIAVCENEDKAAETIKNLIGLEVKCQTS
jgi:hypothetical protein